MTSFSPGPWTVTVVKGSYLVPFLVTAGEEKVVAQCKGDQLAPNATSIGEAGANARLIAAAPEMYEELKAVLFAMERTIPDAKQTIDNIKSILKKVEG